VARIAAVLADHDDSLRDALIAVVADEAFDMRSFSGGDP
jgi:hypothetical protein